MQKNNSATTKESSHYTPDPEKNRRSRKILLTVLFSCIGVLVVIFGIIFIPYLSSTAAQAHQVRIPRNATGKQVRDTLYRYFDHGYADKVLAVMQASDTKPVKTSGSYEIEEGMSAWEAGRKIINGNQTPVRLTFNGFRNFDLLADRIGIKLEMSSDTIRKVFSDSTLLASLGLTPQERIALFLEDTHEVYWNTSPQKLFQKLAANYKRVWNDTRRKKAADLGLTPAEVMIICSIVDEETNAAQEKGTVGRLYINRLEKGMKLQADPTVRFALNDFTIRRVTSQHLTVDSPYNTYKVTGLPPGPIRTTSVATIDSVLNSQPHDYLYMCAKEDFSGTHNFAADYATHQENARRYQNALNERGIK